MKFTKEIQEKKKTNLTFQKSLKAFNNTWAVFWTGTLFGGVALPS